MREAGPVGPVAGSADEVVNLQLTRMMVECHIPETVPDFNRDVPLTARMKNAGSKQRQDAADDSIAPAMIHWLPTEQ